MLHAIQRIPKEVNWTLNRLNVYRVKPTRRDQRAFSKQHVAPATITSRNDTGNGPNFCLWNAQSITNKTSVFSDYVLQMDIDCCFVVETWLRDCDSVVIRELTPPGTVS